MLERKLQVVLFLQAFQIKNNRYRYSYHKRQLVEIQDFLKFISLEAKKSWINKLKERHFG